MNKSKKRNAPGTAIPKAQTAANAKNIINESVPENDDFVKSEAWLEIESLFLELPPETKRWFVDWAKLYFKDTAFKEAFVDYFGEDWQRLNFQGVPEFVGSWKAVRA